MEVYVPVLIALLLLSAFFSSAETAFLSLDRVQLEHRRQEDLPGVNGVVRLLDSPRRLLSSILLGNNLVNAGAAAVATVIAADIVGGGADVVAATLTVTVLLVIFGELGPKTVALHHNFPLARAYARPLIGWAVITRPVVAVLDSLNHVLLRLVGEQTDVRRALSLGELRAAIRMGAESGAIEADESSMLLGALRLQQRQVRRIMTARVDMVVAEANEVLPDLAARLAESGFLRLPVYSGSTDNIVGYVHVSDLNDAFAKGLEDVTARDLMREPMFDSERASTARVLESMQASGNHLAILVDEFGATAGLVTLEDIIEEVVGEIRSESGPQRSDVDVRIGGRLYVEGRRPLGDLSQDLGIEIEQTDAETVAGLILAHLRHMPARGEFVETQGIRLTVMAADERRISLVSAEIIASVDDEDAPATET
jgi:putative hemolysin